MSPFLRSRRQFLKASGAACGAAMIANLGFGGPPVPSRGSDRIRVGVVGCGGRGTRAARDCVNAAPGVEIVALADLFETQVRAAQEKLKVPDAATFWGFDACRRLVAHDLDLVILAAPPGFRPSHFAAAVDAGRHVFMEKPVAVDPAGCRRIIATARLAREKRLAVVAGTQRRHQKSYLETIRRLHDGAIGEITGGQCYWLSGGIWFREKTGWLEGLSDFEWQCWNWYHWDWLSGDQIVEQHIHNIDVMNWVMGGPPAKFLGMGGRQSRGEIPGNIWDHFSVELEYPGGVRVASFCRHSPRSAHRVGERVVGTRGASDCSGVITGASPFEFTGPEQNPMVQEHTDLIASIRANDPLNEGEQVALSTLTAVGGRMSAYSGREISWNWLLHGSKLDLFPKEPAPGPGIFPPIPVPGTTELT